MEKITNVDTILEVIFQTGKNKREVPMHLRGYVNLMGLYVQLETSGRMCRLQAGDRDRSCFDALGDLSSYFDAPALPLTSEDIVWDIRKFDTIEWESRFAHLLEPTFEIASSVSSMTRYKADDAQIVIHALEELERTGKWIGVYKYTCTDCKSAVPYGFRYVGDGSCPQCGGRPELKWREWT